MRVGWMRHSGHSYPAQEAREELTTNAHDDALKHLKHDAIEARGTGPAGIWRSGGSITAESFYNMEPHKAPET
jgi:hypothetical protein